MLVRSVSQKTDDRSKLLKAFGRLADGRISSDTRTRMVEKITSLLAGKPATQETFKSYGIEATSIKDPGKPEIIEISVPAEYLPQGASPDGSPIKVSFTITKVLDMDFRNR